MCKLLNSSNVAFRVAVFKQNDSGLDSFSLNLRKCSFSGRGPDWAPFSLSSQTWLAFSSSNLIASTEAKIGILLILCEELSAHEYVVYFKMCSIMCWWLFRMPPCLKSRPHQVSPTMWHTHQVKANNSKTVPSVWREHIIRQRNGYKAFSHHTCAGLQQVSWHPTGKPLFSWFAHYTRTKGSTTSYFVNEWCWELHARTVSMTSCAWMGNHWVEVSVQQTNDSMAASTIILVSDDLQPFWIYSKRKDCALLALL